MSFFIFDHGHVTIVKIILALDFDKGDRIPSNSISKSSETIKLKYIGYKYNVEMNKQLVESICQVIQSLSDEERCLRLAPQSLLEAKLYTNLPYPSQEEIIALAETSNVFNFLNDEPDLYSLEDGEAV